MALRCSVLQRDPISCVSSKLQQFVGFGSILSEWHCVAVCYSTTQYRVSAANCSSLWVLEVFRVYGIALQCVAARPNIMCQQQIAAVRGFWKYCSMLLCVAVCCSTTQYRVSVTDCSSSWGLEVLQCIAVCCSVLQCADVFCSSLQCIAVCCSVLQCVAVCCSVLQCVPISFVGGKSHHSVVYCNVLQHCVAECCIVLQCVAALCCRVLHCVVVCCSVSQCCVSAENYSSSSVADASLSS